MTEIQSIQDIIDLAKQPGIDWKAYGEVATDKLGDFILFNYTPKAVYENRWNFFERVSRGLIIDRREGVVAALPFPKFFNWSEGGRITSAPIRTITEKVDGSLGLLLRYNGNYRIATRGSFSSDQANWATKFLNAHYNLDDLHPDVTLIFEIVYPENRIVVDYGNTEALYLLAARNRRTGAFFKHAGVQSLARYYGFPTPRVYTFSTIAEIIAFAKKLDANHEGFVVEFEDGQRFKFKGSAYLDLARMVNGLSFKRVLEAIIAGTLDDLRALLPEEFRTQVDMWAADIEGQVAETMQRARAAYEQAPRTSGRAVYAQWVRQNNPDLAPYLFTLLDGKDIRPLVLKKADFTPCALREAAAPVVEVS